MTREEAIQVLTDIKRIRSDEIAKAIDMAIEALSEVRCNDCKWNDDVVEVVRCKDCRWWSCTDSLYQHNSHLCRYWKSTNTSAEDFCSYGERQCNYFGERREK